MHIALFQPEIAQNVGNIARTCACTNTTLHIIHPCNFPFDNKRLLRCAMDYWDKTTIIHHDTWANFIAATTSQRILLLDTKGTTPYIRMQFQPNDILLAGKESSGVPEYVWSQSHDSLYIPMHHNTRSLNVSVAVSFVLGESLRQTSLAKNGML